MGEMTNTYTSLGEKPDGKRLLRRPSCRLQDHIKVHLKEIQL